MRRGWLCVLFFLSGASALIYELVWQRLLILVFGVSTLSVSAVLASFMCGLALGGIAFGRLADRTARPLRLYGWLEAAIAITGLLVPLAFSWTRELYPWLHHLLDLGAWGGALLRLSLSLLVLVVPATLIGGTLPVMGRLLLRDKYEMPATFSLVYAVNTFGAVLGAGLTGFLTLRYLGMQQTLWLAAGFNIVVALAALCLSVSRDEAPVVLAAPAKQPVAANARHRLALVVAVLTGASGMGFEVVWTRILGILTSNSAFGFALLLTVMLFGLSLGSFLQMCWSRKPGDHWTRLALCQWGLVGITIATVPFFQTAPAWLDRLCDGSSVELVFFGELALTASALLAPAILMGLSLPLLVAGIAGAPGSFGRMLGRVYALNTLGCVAGAFLTGFVLVPQLGIHATIGIVLAATATSAVMALQRASGLRPGTHVVSSVLALGAGIACWLCVPEGRYLKSAIAAPRKLLYYTEGNNATVSVLQEYDGTKSISVDGQPVAGTVGTSVIDQKMLAHLPLLLHAAPHKALTVGFGSGGTSYSMCLHDIDVDCVELEARVPSAAGLFESENHGVRDEERFHLIVDDARSWLHVAPSDYDAIVTDCTNIQYRSNGDLYTVEYFQLMKRRLAPGGIAAAWIPANGIAEKDLKILLRTFRAVFPHTTIWYMNTLPTDFLIVIGTPQRVHIDLEALRRRMAVSSLARDLREVGLSDALRLVYTLIVGEDEAADYVGAGALHTDDRPVLSYSTYGASFKSTIAGNLSRLLTYRKDPAPGVLHPADATLMLRHLAASNELILGHIAHLAGEDRAAVPHYQRAAQLLPGDLAIQALSQPAFRSARAGSYDAP